MISRINPRSFRRRLRRRSAFLGIALSLTFAFPSKSWFASSAESHVRSLRPIVRQFQQQQTPQPGQSKKEGEGYLLEVGKQIESTLTGGETHVYKVNLFAGQFMHVVFEQQGVDVAVKLWVPDGQKPVEFDSRWHGPEPVSAIARVAGEYRLEVSPRELNAAPGRYEVKLVELRPVALQDETRIAAETLSSEGKQLLRQITAPGLFQAIKRYEEALPLWRKLGDQFGEAQTLNSLGFVYASITQFQKARDHLNQAVVIRHNLGDRYGEAETLNNLGVTFSTMGEKHQALDYYSQALEIWRAIGERRWEANTLSSMAAAYSAIGEYLKALEYSNQALPLHRALGEKRGEALALLNLGATYNQLGENRKGIKCFEQSLPLFIEAKDRRGEANALNNLGKVHSEMGEQQRAMDYLRQALALFRELSDRRGEAVTLSSIGVIYSLLGEKQQSLAHMEQSLQILRAIKDRAAEAGVLINMGSLLNGLGDQTKALEFFNQARTLSQEIKDRRAEAMVLNHLGIIYFQRGERDKATDYFTQALSLSREIKERRNEASTLINLGDLFATSGASQKALELINQALQVAQATPNREGEIRARRSIASIERSRGDLVVAHNQIEEALKLIESLRVELASQELRVAYRASVQSYYELEIDLLMSLHQQQPGKAYDAAALHVSERARARSLLELLTEARADIRQGVEPQLLQSEREVLERLAARSERLSRLRASSSSEKQAAAATNEEARLKKEIDALTIEFQDVQAEIRQKSLRYAALTQPQPSTLNEIQQQLDADTLLLEYTLGEERSYLWAVTPTDLKSYALPKRAEVEDMALGIHNALSAMDGRRCDETEAQSLVRRAKAEAQYSETAPKLSQMLLGPVAAQLGNKRLLIVADGALQYVPFGALPVLNAAGQKATRSGSWQPLLVDHEIVSLPSASTIAVLRRELAGRQPAPQAVAVLADPVFDKKDERFNPNVVQVKNRQTRANRQASFCEEIGPDQPFWKRLYWSKLEAESIVKFAPTNQTLLALDFRASRALAMSEELSKYRIIHFSTHGKADSERPELSTLVFSLFDERKAEQDGYLRAQEIYNLNLPAELVVLSACETGLGKRVKGEGIIGLTRGFMYAGAKRVVVSLWSVNDAATADLMERFYRKLLKDRMRPAAALRAAQLEMWKRKGFSNPFFWAGFVLQGEWK